MTVTLFIRPGRLGLILEYLDSSKLRGGTRRARTSPHRVGLHMCLCGNPSLCIQVPSITPKHNLSLATQVCAGHTQTCGRGLLRLRTTWLGAGVSWVLGSWSGGGGHKLQWAGHLGLIDFLPCGEGHGQRRARLVPFKARDPGQGLSCPGPTKGSVGAPSGFKCGPKIRLEWCWVIKTRLCGLR